MIVSISKDSGHKHMAYLRQEEGVTSTDKGHVHNLYNDGENWIVDEADGHVHQIEEVKTVERKDKMSDEAKVKELYQLYKSAKEYEHDWRKKAYNSENFYSGEQWDKVTKISLEQQNRATVTINETAGKIDLLSGYQRQNRSDFKFFPVEEGDVRVAQILDIVVKNILENSNFIYEETDVFLDEIITGRGLYNVYIDYDKNIEGEIVVEHMPWNDVYFGPHNKKDLSDCEYLIKAKMYSKEKVKQLWPEKAESIEKFMELTEETGSDEQLEIPGLNYVVSDKRVLVDGDPIVDLLKREFRVFELWRKIYRTTHTAKVMADNFVENLDNFASADVAMLKTIPGMKIHKRNVFDIRKTMVAGGQLLEENVEDLPDGAVDFHLCVAYAKKRGKKFWGKVEEIKDVQNEINKRHSQTIDIMNRMAAYGWFVDYETFRNPQDEEMFKKNSSTPGFIGKVENLDRIPQKVEGARFPNDIIGLEQISSDKLAAIMNIPPEMQGFGGADASGKSIIEKRRQGLVGNEYLFDNMDLAKKKLAKLIIAYIQELYTPARIVRIIRQQGVENELTQMDDIAIATLLQETDLTKFDIVVGQSEHSPTMRAANFFTWSEMAKQGFPVPPEMLIDLSDLPNKEKVLEQISGQQQAAQQAEQQKANTEIQKTLIAAQAKQQQPGV